MIISDIRYDSGKNRFIVDTDGARFFLSYETYDAHTLKKGMDISALESAFAKESERMTAMDYAYRLLARRAVSSEEVITKLKQRGVPRETAEEILTYLAGQGLIDDTAYLNAAVADQIRLKGYGPWRIVSNLRSKGFRKEEVLAVYHRLTDAEEESVRARDFARRKWPGVKGKTDAHRKKKLADQLLRQGFSYDTVTETMETLPE